MVVRGDVIVRADFEVEDTESVIVASAKRKSPPGIEILYSDSDIIVINKFEGLLSVPLEKTSSVHALGLLREQFNTKQVFAVHRIDRETSGVMIFARNNKSMAKLLAMFKDHAFTREYLAIVMGRIFKKEGTWKSRLVEKNNFDVVSTQCSSQGKMAVTHYSVIRRSKNFSFLRLRLETGKKHQIRVHCNEAGHPIVGDKRYAPFCNPIFRMCLHANLLEFVHPMTGKKMSFTAPLPRKFSGLGFVGI